MRSNYSREERQKIIEEYLQSGKTQTEFAPEYGIKPNTLSGWVNDFRKKTDTQLQESHFVELKTPAVSVKENIIIRKSGIEIEVPSSCTQTILAEILSAAAAL